MAKKKAKYFSFSGSDGRGVARTYRTQADLDDRQGSRKNQGIKINRISRDEAYSRASESGYNPQKMGRGKDTIVYEKVKKRR